VKRFKARIEMTLYEQAWAIEVWFPACNIIDAGEVLLDRFGVIGVDADNVVKLIELDK